MCRNFHQPSPTLPSVAKLGTRLVVKLRGDVQAHRLRQLVVRCHLRATIWQIVDFLQASKFAALHFFPGWLHISDGLHHVLVLFTCQLVNLEYMLHLRVDTPFSNNGQSGHLVICQNGVWDWSLLTIYNYIIFIIVAVLTFGKVF